ncbi:hypothetical protein LguiB_035572 [Lonicera macranthoides]
MGTQVPVVVKIPSSLIRSSQSPLINLIPRTHISSTIQSSRARRCSTSYGRSRWDSNAEKNVRTERFGDDDEGFGSTSDGKKRVWWSDEGFVDDDDDDDEARGEDEFWFREASIGIGWTFKLFRAFGWMLPAIGISMLMGTGSSTFVMALALPLAQSALSFVTDALLGRWSDNPRPKPRTKKRPFSRAASNVGTSKAKEQYPRTCNGRDNYWSRTTANEASVRKGDRRQPNFGGWDDLDKRVGPEKDPRMAQTEKTNEPRQQKKIKISKRVRNREKPLLLRLLIAVFPFLGSWTKLL